VAGKERRKLEDFGYWYEPDGRSEERQRDFEKVEVKPRSALVAGENGLADLRHLINNAPVHLKDNGYLLLEHGWKQGEEVRSIFWQNHWQGVATIRDYGDNERVTLGYWKR
jgi:release factor glutamine methyltransferase